MMNRKKFAYFFILLTMFFAGRVSGSPVADADTSTKNILFLGDSITAGLGVGKDHAYPAIIQQKIDSLGWNYNVINGGLSGETSAGGLRRINWMLKQPVDMMILELGGNDGLRGIDPSSTRKNLQGIIDSARSKNPDIKIVLAGMQIPPNLGQDYTKEFKDIYPELAKKNDLPFIPFLLENVGGKPEFNQGDGIHPNEKGHKIVAQNVWDVLKPLLLKMKNS